MMEGTPEYVEGGTRDPRNPKLKKVDAKRPESKEPTTSGNLDPNKTKHNPAKRNP